jgi:hypothetical protein
MDLSRDWQVGWYEKLKKLEKYNRLSIFVTNLIIQTSSFSHFEAFC